MADFVDDFGQKIVDVHEQWECLGRYCTIHKQSDHKMRGMKQRWRMDRALMERVCSHGVGHPDPDEIGLEESGRGVHGCDGCCYVEKIELEDVSDAQQLAVEIIMNEGALREREALIEIIDSRIEAETSPHVKRVLQALTMYIRMRND